MPWFLPHNAEVLKMVFKYTSTRGLCGHLQIYFCLFICFLIILRNELLQNKAYKFHFSAFWKLHYTENKTSSSLLPHDLWSGRGLWKRRVKGRRLRSGSWCPAWEPCPGPWAFQLCFSLWPESVYIVQFWSPGWKWLYMWLLFFFFFTLTHVLGVSSDFWRSGLWIQDFS